MCCAPKGLNRSVLSASYCIRRVCSLVLHLRKNSVEEHKKNRSSQMG